MTTVFISHSTRDSNFARRKLKPYLEGHGITAWLSEQDIPTAVDWERNIRRALSNAQWCIVVLSPDAVKSDWVEAEVHWALEKRKGRVIPVMIRDCDPGDLHLKLPRIQYIDLRTDAAAGARRLLDILRGSGLPESDGAESPDFEDEETTIVGARETLLRLSVESGPLKGQSLAVRIRRDCVIGRGKDADLRIRDDCVSRHHARLSISSWKGARQCLITDLESANGTFVNERRIVAPQTITAGDLIDLGETRLRVDSCG